MPYKVSLTWPALNSAHHLVLLAAGAEKAEAVRAGHGEIDPWNVPASSVRGLTSTTWYLDEASAAGLDPVEDAPVESGAEKDTTA